MIRVRDVFQLKFGAAREAAALWREGIEIGRRIDAGGVPPRVLTDLTGPYYTLVLESSFPSLADYEKRGTDMMRNDEWKGWYRRFVPLVERGRREIFTILE